jgi:hypothetical protein
MESDVEPREISEVTFFKSSNPKPIHYFSQNNLILIQTKAWKEVIKN